MFKNSSFPAVLRDVVKSVVISFNLGPEESLRPTTTSKDFGSSKKLELMPKLGDSSSSLVIFWSLKITMVASLAAPFHSFSAICRLIDSLTFSFPSLFYCRSRRLCKSFKPYDFLRVLVLYEYLRGQESLWSLVYIPGRFFCFYEVLLWNVDVSRMNFNRSAAFLIFNAHFEQTQEDN